MRSRISWYGKTMGHVRDLKERFRTAAEPRQMRSALAEWLDRTQGTASPQWNERGVTSL
jgi:hypothetical protein